MAFILNARCNFWKCYFQISPKPYAQFSLFIRLLICVHDLPICARRLLRHPLGLAMCTDMCAHGFFYHMTPDRLCTFLNANGL